MEQARQDVPRDYHSTIATDEDDAEQLKSSLVNKLIDLKDELKRTERKLNRANDKLTKMKQVIVEFEEWLSRSEQSAKISPKQITEEAFVAAITQCDVSYNIKHQCTAIQ